MYQSNGEAALEGDLNSSWTPKEGMAHWILWQTATEQFWGKGEETGEHESWMRAMPCEPRLLEAQRW